MSRDQREGAGGRGNVSLSLAGIWDLKRGKTPGLSWSQLFTSLGPTWELLLSAQVMVLWQVVSSVSPPLWQSCFLLASRFHLCKRQCGSQLFSAPKKAEATASISSWLAVTLYTSLQGQQAGWLQPLLSRTQGRGKGGIIMTIFNL